MTALPSYEGAVASFFRPEFFNRIDAVVRFTPLSHDDVLTIARKELAEIASREGLVQSRLTIEPSDRLVEHVAAAGFDARFGARPLQRVLERQIVSPLARWLLDHRELTDRRLRLDLDAADLLQVEITGA